MISDPKSDESAKPCVICKKPQDPVLKPFCSKRCADIDLNRWLSGNYVIPGGAPPPEGVDDEE